jgi:hypothetical protein
VTAAARAARLRRVASAARAMTGTNSMAATVPSGSRAIARQKQLFMMATTAPQPSRSCRLRRSSSDQIRQGRRQAAKISAAEAMRSHATPKTATRANSRTANAGPRSWTTALTTNYALYGRTISPVVVSTPVAPRLPPAPRPRASEELVVQM